MNSRDALKFQFECGVDEVIGAGPVNKRASRAPRLRPPSTPLDLPPANSLEELKAMVQAFEGCALKKTALNTVFADGNPKARVMVIGEAPGAEEDRLGLPFVGLSGRLLDTMFATIGLTRETFYITNIIPWRPPDNRLPTPSEITLCLPFVRRHIELIQPEYLVLVGGVSSKALLETTDGIIKLRGVWQPYHSPGLTKPIKALAMFHPAYLLRSPSQKKYTWLDLLLLKRTLEGGDDLRA